MYSQRIAKSKRAHTHINFSNFLLAVGRVVGVDSKYRGYRTTELSISFALEAYNVSIAEKVRSGLPLEDAVLVSGRQLFVEVEELVMGEFRDYFSHQRTIDQVHEDVSALRSKKT